MTTKKLKELLFKNTVISPYYTEHRGGTMTPKMIDGVINFYQCWDITIFKYQVTLHHEEIPDIEIYGLIGKKWVKLDGVDGERFRFVLDFNNPITKIKYVSTNDFFDPIVFDCKYNLADRKEYDKWVCDKNEEARKDTIKKIGLTCVPGNSLVNIYWNNVNDKIDKTVITLIYRPRLGEPHTICEEKIGSKITFKSISGLAYGNYNVTLVQYDKKNKVIGEAKGYFTLTEPGAKRAVYI